MAIYYENGLWLGLFRDDFREEDLKVEEKQIQVRKGWWRQRCGHVVPISLLSTMTEDDLERLGLTFNKTTQSDNKT